MGEAGEHHMTPRRQDSKGTEEGGKVGVGHRGQGKVYQRGGEHEI